MIESIMKYLCAMIGILLAVAVVIICWIGPIFMTFWLSPWWLFSYGITLPVFFGICDWAEGDGFNE